MEVLDGLFYSKEHEWVKLEGKKAVIGISDYAQHSLVDITFVELPAEGIVLKQFDKLAVVESVKAVSDVYCPLSGKVKEVNSALSDKPELVNKSPYSDGWIAVIEAENPDEVSNLMDSSAYKKYLETLSE